MFTEGHKFISLGQNCLCLPSLNIGVTSLHFTSLHPVKVFFIVYYLVIASVFPFEIFSFSVEILFRVAIRKVFIFSLVSGFCCVDQLTEQCCIDLC